MAVNLEGITFKNFVNGLTDATENTETKVPGVNNSSLKKGSVLSNAKVVSNSEYVYALVDSNNVFLFGIKKDGSVEWAKGIPEPIKTYVQGLIDGVGGDVSALAERMADVESGKVDKVEGKSLVNSVFAEGVKVVQNAEYVYAVVDLNDVFLFGVKTDGSFEFSKGIPEPIESEILNSLLIKVDKVEGKSLVDSVFAEGVKIVQSPDYIFACGDKIGRFLFGIKKDGSVEFASEVRAVGGIAWEKENLNDLKRALIENGVKVDSLYDWSSDKTLHIPVPKLGIVNISAGRSLPLYKGDVVNGVLEFWDLSGNYFKKNAILDVQGNSTQWFPKKNYAVDLCNDEWVGDDTFGLKFGSWVEQDSFHLKAWWVDMFRGCGQAYYQLLRDIWSFKRGVLDRPWKKAMVASDRLTNKGFGCSYGYTPDALDLRLDTGAECCPDGFPIIVFHNGSFLGIYSFAMKKHRSNYHMGKKNYSEVLIDGVLFADEFWAGPENIDWTKFELKNPKKLICMDGSEYDGDNPLELIDETSGYWTESKDQKNTRITKNAIKALSAVMPQIESAVSTYGVDSQEVINLYETYFDVDNLIDYILFSDVVLDLDTGENNVLWTTWDGVKWFACPYDIDRILGMWGGYCYGNSGSVLLTRAGLPTYYIGLNATFKARLAERYAELRNGGIFTQENLISYCLKWVKSVGFENYEKEFERWPQNIVNNDSVVNSQYWAIDSGDIRTEGTWSADTSYSVGDVVYYGAGNVSGSGTVCGFYKFTCVAENTNQRPFSALRCKDSIWRLNAWIEGQLRAMDNKYNYN